MNQSIIIGILALVGSGAVAALVSGLFQRPKSRAETNKLVAEAGASIDQRWKAWAEELEARLRTQDEAHTREMSDIRAEVKVLTAGMATEKRTVERLRADLGAQKQVTRTVLAWAIAMRREVTRLDGDVPELPATVQTYIDLMDERPDRAPGEA